MVLQARGFQFVAMVNHVATNVRMYTPRTYCANARECLT